MQAYLAGNAVTLRIPLVDDNGAVVEATAIDYQVVDHLGTILVVKVALPGFVSPAEEALVTVAAPQNALAVGAVREGRQVNLFCTTSAGITYLNFGYVIEAAEILVEGDNSFQSLTHAELTAFGMPDMVGWSAATKAQKISAMLRAHQSICQFRYRYEFDLWQDRVERSFGVNDLSLLTVEQYNELPEEFQTALRNAQVVQAEDVLNGDPNATLREQGVMSQTVGESSQMFRPGKPISLPICREAFKYLAKYVVTSVRIGRA